jgi:hypothetical protein
MSLDETATLHEKLLHPVRNALHAEGFFYFAWVIPGALFVLGFLAVTFGFLRRLAADTRRRFLVAGFIYVSGSLGMEMVGGHYEFVHGSSSTP